MRGHNRKAEKTLVALGDAAGSMQEWPETEEEAKHATTFLDRGQIRSILAGPSVLHFGTCSSAVKITKHFFVSNKISSPIHVVVDAQAHQHLNQSQHCSQVCPA